MLCHTQTQITVNFHVAIDLEWGDWASLKDGESAGIWDCHSYVKKDWTHAVVLARIKFKRLSNFMLQGINWSSAGVRKKVTCSKCLSWGKQSDKPFNFILADILLVTCLEFYILFCSIWNWSFSEIRWTNGYPVLWEIHCFNWPWIPVW